jgi:hypothetical protein
MKAGQQDDRPANKVMGLADRPGESLVGRECRGNSEQPEKGEGFALRPAEQEAQHDLANQQGIKQMVRALCCPIRYLRFHCREATATADAPDDPQDQDGRQEDAQRNV